MVNIAILKTANAARWMAMQYDANYARKREFCLVGAEEDSGLTFSADSVLMQFPRVELCDFHEGQVHL